jgi:Carboxypeptidase regulatory-like domain
MKRFVFAIAVLLASLFAAPAHAATSGALIGYVHDARGRVVSGAVVRAMSPAQVAETTTDARGFYSFVNLVPGTYLVTSRKPELMPGYEPGVVVDAGIQTNANVRQPVGFDDTYHHGPQLGVNAARPAGFYTIDRSNPLLNSSPDIYDALRLVPGVLIGSGAPSQ